MKDCPTARGRRRRSRRLNFFAGVETTLPCHRTARHTWAERLEGQAAKGRPEFAPPGPHLGIAFTASAAWETIRAARGLHAPRGVMPVWGLNHRFGLIGLERR